MGTLTIEGRNNPDTHWVVLNIVVVKSAHGNSVNKYVYEQQHICILTYIPTHIRFTVCISNLALKYKINCGFV